jgi:hypothetical protein
MEIDNSDYVIIKITKSKFMGEPSGWMVDIQYSDEDAAEQGGTAPTFAGVFDIAYSIIAGGDKHNNYEYNEWALFDANERNKKWIQ